MSKLSGRALQIVGCNTINYWKDLKSVLELNFADQRSEKCLLMDVMNLKPTKNESPYNFGNRCKDTLNLLLCKVKSSETDANFKVKSSIYNETILGTYLRGLMQFGSLGDKIRFRNPDSLSSAMAYVLEEENFLYSLGTTTNLNQNYKPIKLITPTLSTPHYKSTHAPIQVKAPTFPTPQFHVPQTNYNNRPMTFNRPIGQNHDQVYRPQQAPAQYIRHQTPPFKFAKSPGQLQERRQPRSTPMDVSVARTRATQNYFRPTGPVNWVSEELHQQEEATNDPYENQHWTEEQYYQETDPEGIESQQEYIEETEESANFTYEPRTHTTKK